MQIEEEKEEEEDDDDDNDDDNNYNNNDDDDDLTHSGNASKMSWIWWTFSNTDDEDFKWNECILLNNCARLDKTSTLDLRSL